MTKANLCNLCGETTYLGKCHQSSGLNAQVSGGYDSTPGNGFGALDDNTTYQFTLCEFCLDWLMSQFKIPPQVSDYVNPSYTPEAFRPAAERVTQDSWRTFKNDFFTEKAKRDSLRSKKRKK